MIKNKLIIIFGPSGAGKTTLSKEIVNFIGTDNSFVISQDNYYLGIEKMKDENFDKPSALDFDLMIQNIDNLLNNKSVNVPIYNFVKHQREDFCNMYSPKQYIILEGTLVANNKHLLNLASFKIYYDIGLDICLTRRLSRDILERGRDIDGVIKQYLKDVRPAFFDYIYPFKEVADFCYNEENKIKLFEKIREII